MRGRARAALGIVGQLRPATMNGTETRVRVNNTTSFLTPITYLPLAVAGRRRRPKRLAKSAGRIQKSHYGIPMNMTFLPNFWLK